MSVFKNEEAAQKEASRKNKHDEPKEYCPLTQSNCKKNCICFERANVKCLESDKYIVLGFYCDNAMFFEHYINH